MNVTLDTNALLAWADADTAFLRVLPKDRLWRLPVVVLGEFLFGIRRSRKRAKLEQWIEKVKATCALLAVDANTADRYADIREELPAAAAPIPENDLWNAALCRQHQLAVASRDGHFDEVRGLKRAPW